MIIFDLDGTLANCEHRRHFVDWHKTDYSVSYDKWKPDWNAFYEACDRDEPNDPVVKLYKKIWFENDYYESIEIWSGRSECVRKKTEDWLDRHDIRYFNLKMRPIGNYAPDEELKEMWLHDAKILEGKNIEYVFDDRPKVVRMWRRHGIFVFNCNQSGEEF